MAEPKPNMDVLWSETGEIITPPTTKVEEGWVSEKPPYQTFNWLLNRSDRFLKHIDEHGLPEWSASVTYDTGALAMYNGSVCESLQDSNVGNVPGTAGWWNVGAYVKRFGDTMEDKLTVVSTTDETLDLQSRGVGETVSTRLLDSNGEPLVTISSNDTNRNAVVEIHGASGNVTGSFTLAEPGRISVSSEGVSNADELTRKDYVDAQVRGYFPAGTRVAFHQENAPAGWTQDTSVTDAMLRVVSGVGGGNGGSDSATSLPHTHSTVPHSHSDSNHQHELPIQNSGGANATYMYMGFRNFGTGGNITGGYYPSQVVTESSTGASWLSGGPYGDVTTGSASPNTESGVIAPKYIDMIVCEKD